METPDVPVNTGVEHGPKTEIESYKDDYREVLLEGSAVDKLMQWFRNRGNGVLIAFSMSATDDDLPTKKLRARNAVEREIEEQAAVRKLGMDVKPLLAQFKKCNDAESKPVIADLIVAVFANHLNSAGNKSGEILEEIIKLSKENGLFEHETLFLDELHIARSGKMKKDLEPDSFGADLKALLSISSTLQRLFSEMTDESKKKSLDKLHQQAVSKALSVLSEILNRTITGKTGVDIRGVDGWVIDIVNSLANRGFWSSDGTRKQLHIERSLKPKERSGSSINLKDLTAALTALELKK